MRVRTLTTQSDPGEGESHWVVASHRASMRHPPLATLNTRDARCSPLVGPCIDRMFCQQRDAGISTGFLVREFGSIEQLLR